MMPTRDTDHRGFPLRPRVWGAAVVLLVLPAIAMQFTDEVRWTPLDFAVFAAMLAIAGGLYELAARLPGHRTYRAAAAVAVGGGFLMTWANLAVGIIGDEAAAVNLAFFGVLALGLVGGWVVRFRAAGLAGVLTGMAAMQAIVHLAAASMGLGQVPWQAWAFVGVWLVAAGLFVRAAKRPA